ncbi:MAG: D-alanyl-D-alanine carboxypeptidase [Bacilli bacterium]|nr:D-alanyl-D-alanine carboxypeptidase [Bacilli bacterium]
MKRVIIFLLLFSIWLPVNALTVSSEAVILMDQDSSRVIYAKNENKQMLIASITKIMTAVLAIESNRLDEKVIVDENILKAYGSNIYIQVGEEISLKDLVYGLMLRSGNDAALMIANYISGSEKDFVHKMNEKAKKIGMKNTVFVNPHGLDENGGNLSTAYDMALLTRYAQELSDYKKITRTKVKTTTTNYKSYVWQNKNKLLDIYKWSTGGKTGFTEKAGRTLVSTATKGNMNFIVVTLNDHDDWNTHQTLFNYGFTNFHNYLVLNQKTFDLNSDYYKGKIYINNNYHFPLRTSETGDIYLKAKIVKQKHYQDKNNIGVVEVYFKDKLVHTEDLFIEVRKQKTTSKSLWQRILDWFNL